MALDKNLVTMCNWAMREGGVKFPGGVNPGVAVKCYRVAKQAITFLKLQDIREQLDSLEENIALQTMVAVYIYAGLRREEALWLTHEDIEWDWGQFGAIWIKAKAVDEESWMSKTGEDRIVPISSQLRVYLDRYVKAVEKSGPWFFKTPKSKRWDPDNFSEWLRDANAQNDLNWSCLDFRHTFGSQLAMKGESLYKISRLLGNSPEICRKHYAAVMPESLMDSVEFPTEKEKKMAGKAKGMGDAEAPRLRLVVNK